MAAATAQRERRAAPRPSPFTIDNLLRPGIIILTGSDGVGKTTTAAAIALRAAARTEMRTAVLTIDPARRLANAMGLERLGNRLRKVTLPAGAGGGTASGTLHAGMLETKSAWDELIIRQAGGRENAQPILANPFYKEISGAFVGSHEYIAMERLYDIWQSEKFDLVVLDTPPSRNALDFLEAPSRMTELIGGGLLGLLARPGAFAGRIGLRMFSLTAKPVLRIGDRLLGSGTLGELSEFLVSVEGLYDGFKERAEAVYDLLGRDSTSFVVVTTLEEVPFEEARYFVEKLREAHMHLRGVIVNKQLPQALLDPDAAELARVLARSKDDVMATLGKNFLAYRTLAQRDRDLLDRIRELSSTVIGAMPRMPEPVHDMKGLVEVGELLAQSA
jgi:anion-transporting  ArsA/GET3 family ATPase